MRRVTVTTTSRIAGPFTGTGANATLAFSFKCFTEADVQVLRDGAELTLTSQYSVSLNADQENSPGGSVTIFAAYNTLGSQVYVTSNIPASQPVSLPSQSSWSPKVVEQALDRLAIIFQQALGALNRSVIAPIGETLGALPSASGRAGKFLGFDAGGAFTVLTGTGADAALRTDLAATGGAGLIGTSAGGTVQTSIDKIRSRSLGTLASGGTIPLNISTDFIAAVDGTTDFRGVLLQAQLNGANSAAQVNAQNIQVELGHAVGKTVTVTHGNESYIRLGLQKSAVGNITSARVFEGHVANESLGAIIASAFVFYVNDTDYADDIAGAAGTITTMVGMGVGNIGHATKNTNAYQFYGANCTASPGITATFYSEMAGAGKWAFYGAGNSPSAILGALKLGLLTAPVEVLDVHGNILSDGTVKAIVGIGYATGAGGSATQSTAKTTAVPLNKACGQITLNAAALAANTAVSFTFNNSFIGPDDDLRVWVKAGNASVGSYRISAEGNANGSRVLVLKNETGGSLSEALVLGFMVHKGAIN